MQSAAKWMTEVSGVKPVLPSAPDGVDVYPRYGSRGTMLILVNFSKADQTISLPTAMSDLLAGGVKQSVTLPVYGVAVLQASR